MVDRAERLDVVLHCCAVNYFTIESPGHKVSTPILFKQTRVGHPDARGGCHQVVRKFNSTTLSQGAMNGAETVRKLVQLAMQSPDVETVSDLSGSPSVPGVDKGIVQQPVIDFLLVSLTGRPVVPVEADLQSAGQPGWHPHVAKAQFLVHEVEAVVQAHHYSA